MKNTKWDKVWKRKKVTSDYSLRLYDFLQSISKKIKPNSKVLEIGCGSGQGLSMFQNHSTTGLDNSKEALKLAKQYCNNVILADANKLPFKADSFDLIYSSGLLEHFKHPKKAMSEIARVTKKGGKIIIIVPNTKCIWYKMYKKIMEVSGKWQFGYEESYDIKRFKKLAENNNLKIEKFFGLQILVPLATNNYQILPEKIRQALVHFEKIFPLKQYYAYGLGMICKK